MRLWLQTLLSVVFLAIGLVVAATLSPAARGYLDAFGVAGALERIGVLSPAGTEAPVSKETGQAAGIVVVANPPPTRVLQEVVTGIGTVHGKQSVVVTAGAAGRITALAVSSGEVVQAGELLVELDSGSEGLAVDKAQLALRDAQANFDRLSRLKTSGSASDQQLQEARLELDTAAVALQSAEYELSQRRILAPITGSVGVMDLSVGDRVVADTVIARIEDRSSLIVDFRVPERFSGHLAVGTKVTAAPLAEPDAGLEAVISALDNRVDEASRSLRLQATIAHPAETLRAGMALRILIAVKGEPLPAVDPLAVQWNSAGPFVWLVRDGKAAKLPVRILQRNADAVLVDAAFLPGDLVVSEGVQELRPGVAVTVAGAGGPAPKS